MRLALILQHIRAQRAKMPGGTDGRAVLHAGIHHGGRPPAAVSPRASAIGSRRLFRAKGTSIFGSRFLKKILVDPRQLGGNAFLYQKRTRDPAASKRPEEKSDTPLSNLNPCGRSNGYSAATDGVDRQRTTEP